MNVPRFRLPAPELQIEFAFTLDRTRPVWLRDALGETVRTLDIRPLDRELAEYVPASALSALAGQGLRGEVMFPVPLLLTANPRLLGYYRLLYGFSQKEFYGQGHGLAKFKPMEEKGTLSAPNRQALPELCRELIECAERLLEGVGPERISRQLLDSLILLTLGPQLRGGANVKIGARGIVSVFEAIHDIVRDAVVTAQETCIEMRSAADRKVLIEFAPDPDIIIREEMTVGEFRNVIAIEVKGGTDFSNVHNRIGEAEKSHQKARANGFYECWTVVNVDRIDLGMARRESPSTNRFYRLSALEARGGDEYQDFRNRIVSLTGIRA
ncbi:MAG TPA: XcyI family restriction endonuclease [Azospirillaceae bacterium]|nr:XcyI family restriction endonuclease [Azospirillaceae bacterium]